MGKEKPVREGETVQRQKNKTKQSGCVVSREREVKFGSPRLRILLSGQGEDRRVLREVILGTCQELVAKIQVYGDKNLNKNGNTGIERQEYSSLFYGDC